MPSETPDDPPYPFPPRYWWLKRVTLGLVLLAVLLAVAWRDWARDARARLHGVTGPVAAAGDPVSAADLQPPPVPDAENGARLYLEAGRISEATKVYSPAGTTMSYAPYPPYPRRWHEAADRSAEKNQPIFALMREARRYQKFDWGVRVAAPAHNSLLPHLNWVRHLAQLAGDAALHAHVNGDDAAALEYVRDALHVGTATEAPPTFLLSHLTAVGIDASVLYRLHLIAGALTVAPAEGGESAPATLPLPRPLKRPATRAQVRALIDELREDRGWRAGATRRAAATERAVQADLADWCGRNVPLLEPMFDLDAAVMLRAADARVRAAAQDDFQAARDVLRNDPALKALPPPQTNVGRGFGRAAANARRTPVDYTRLLASDYSGAISASPDRALDYDARARADRRLAAASLAVQLYRADHGGRVPPSLAALVPTYLPAVPADPMAAGGRPVGYVVAPGALPGGGGDRALVYSTGPDGADDTATRGLPQLPPEPLIERSRGTADDYRDVVRFVPQAKPDPAEEAAEEREWAENEARRRAQEARE